jgi:hypothetical protein
MIIVPNFINTLSSFITSRNDCDRHDKTTRHQFMFHPWHKNRSEAETGYLCLWCTFLKPTDMYLCSRNGDMSRSMNFVFPNDLIQIWGSTNLNISSKFKNLFQKAYKCSSTPFTSRTRHKMPRSTSMFCGKRQCVKRHMMQLFWVSYSVWAIRHTHAYNVRYTRMKNVHYNRVTTNQLFVTNL